MTDWASLAQIRLPIFRTYLDRYGNSAIKKIIHIRRYAKSNTYS